MAVLLNELFFPKTDPHTAALLSAFAFCSTWVFRPFGALLFGWIGDNGRKPTVIITTIMMSISCVIMANLPTYAEIGITSAVIITCCRICQGLSSMGEIMGAEIYIAEITKPPVQYPAVAFLGVSASLGEMFALAIAALVTTCSFNWRIAFWIGAGIAVVGSIARTRLRETPEFIEGKRKLQYKTEKRNSDQYIDLKKVIGGKKVNKRSFLAFFLTFCGWPFCFYLAYMYFNPLLKERWGYSSEDIILHNLILSIVLFSSVLFYSLLSYRIHPLKIAKFRGISFITLACFSPLLINIATSPLQIFFLQAAILATSLDTSTSEVAMFKHFPVLRRFTVVTFIYALTRAVMYVITSFGLVYLTALFGYYAIWLILIPVSMGFLWGVNHFIKLEKASGNFPQPSTCDKALVTR